MSSSAATSIRKSGPRVICPASSQLVGTQTSNRSIRRCSRNIQGSKTERLSRHSDRYQRYFLYNQRKHETCRDINATSNDTHSSWSWAAWLSPVTFSYLPAGRERRLWDSDSGQRHKRKELLKCHMETDPYKAVFGHQLDPFLSFGKNKTLLSDFQSLISMEKSRNVRPKVDKRQTRSNPNRVGLQYDSISGYMVLISAPTTLETSELEAEINTYKVVDSHPGTEVEAKFAHNPSLSKDGQFQPGNTGWSPEAPSSLHSTVECTLADDIGALFTSTPTSQDAQGRLQVPQETKRSPFVNINYSPGSGLGTLYGSDSITSTQPQPDSSSANGDIYKLDLHAGLVTGTNLEGSPGSEPEAKFMPDPANRAVQSSSSGFETQTPSKQTDTSIDCLPGNEVDAKLSSEIGSLGLEYDGPFNQTTNTATMTDAQERAKCSPGSEIKAQILSESASHKITPSEAQTSVDCPPGSELEARLAGNAASIEKSLSQPELPTSLDTSKMTRVAVDNTPRNELKTKIFSEMASAECPSKNKDVTALDASDIRPRYTPLEAKVQANMLDFDASEDRNNDSILESQDSAEKGKQPAASQAPSPQFHILAFDTSTSQVSAAQADSFFAVGEHRQPIEILSRLQNPAKFLPYFEKMQEDGYEIATGGGNILVFRKTQSTPRHTLSETATDQPATHAEISRHPCHNSKDPATTCSRAPWQSTSMLVSATGSSNSSPEPTTKPKSLCREIGRRMLIVGTATAATCYALGVMTEFFRTGGNDRQGIDGFTVLESDRRRQE